MRNDKPEKEHLVFVYGTLRPGKWNNTLLHDSTHLATCHVMGALYMLGTIPGYKPTDHNSNIYPVTGDLYLVAPDVLKRLDRLEGYNEHDHSNSHFYCRELVPCILDDDEIVEAFIYRYVPEVQPQGLITNGDYLNPEYDNTTSTGNSLQATFGSFELGT